MGNSTSTGRGHQQDTVDLGFLIPQGVYTGPRDWNQTVVTQLICERKLAPFYRPLEDYDESWDDDQILAARREPQDTDPSQPESSSARADSISSSASRTHHKRPSNAKEPTRQPEVAVYRGAVECPICFLAICTECFVQIKRVEPTTTHVVSEPACCPYCVQENFGVVYTPPPWRTGIGSEGATPPSWPDSPRGSSSPSTAAMKRRRKSFTHDSPEVVTIDQIRPDWEQKLAAVRAAVARRANRRIIMRQVGDRLIPVGITSGRMHLPTAEEAAQAENGEGGAVNDRGSRRRRRNQNQEINQLLGLGGQDLEELMVMEAMRLSLIEHEEQQKKEREAEAKKKQNAGEGSSDSSDHPESAGPGPSSSSASPETNLHQSTSASYLDEQQQGEGTSPRRTPVSGGSTHGSTPSLSHQLSADQQQPYYGGRLGRRGSPSPTPSQYSIRAALASAASTAGAVVSPGRNNEGESFEDDSFASHHDEIRDGPSRENMIQNDGNDREDLPSTTETTMTNIMHSSSFSSPPPPQVMFTPETGESEVVVPGGVDISQSSASSVTPAAGVYEPLASSPGSSVSLAQKPLLDSSSSPITSVVSAGPANGDPGETHAL